MRFVSLIFCCCSIVAQVVGQLRPIEKCVDEYESFFQTIANLNNVVNFKCFVTFFGNSESTSISPSLQKQLMETFERTMIVAGPYTGSLKEICNDRSLALVFTTENLNHTLDVLLKTLDGLEIAIVFVFKVPVSNDLMESLFNWGTKNKFKEVLITFNRKHQYELWAFKSKPKFIAFQIDQLELSYKSVRKCYNMEQSKSVVGYYESLPDAFLYNSNENIDITNSSISLGGQIGIMLGEFMRFTNGTMDIRHISFEHYFNKANISKNNFDIGANLVVSNSLAPYSPLVMSTRYCIVIPYERRVEIREFLRFFFGNWTITAIWIFNFIAIAIIKRLDNLNMSLATVLYRTFLLSIGETTTSRVFRNLGLAEKIIVVCTLMYHSLITSIICSGLTMALTIGLHKSDIVDVDTFLNSNLRIMIHRQTMYEIFKSNEMPSGLTDRLILVDEETRNKHLYTLNEDYAYVMDEHNWIELNHIQQRLQKPKLKFASDKLCGVYRHLRILISQGHQSTYILRHFVDQSLESGLIDKWMRMGLRQAERAGLIKQAPYEPPFQLPLSLPFFTLLFKLYGIGILISLGTMILELVFMHYSSRRNNNVITV